MGTNKSLRKIMAEKPYYPYGEFPSKYTKSGQEELRKKMLSGGNQPEPVTVTQEKPKRNGIDFHKFLPLIKNMGAGKQLSHAEMLQLVLPMLGGENKDLSEVMGVILSSNEKKESEVDLISSPPDKPSIDSYKRVT